MLTASLLRPFNFRGKARLLHFLCPTDGIRSAHIFGYEVSLDLAKYIERSMYLGIFEPHETALIRSVLKPGMTVVDVGANVGYYSLMASAAVGDHGTIYALEPNPYSADCLQHTILKNKILNLFLSRAAVGDVDGEASLYISNDPNKTSPSMVANQQTTAMRVPVTTLDAFAKASGIDRIDLLKVDVEGFEPNVIRGGAGLLAASRVRHILCEFNQHWLSRNQSSPRALFDLISSFGFISTTEFRSDLPLQNLMFAIPD
jgi:FkbM family methyltransferase